MQASTCCIPRNQEHIYRSPVFYSKFLLKFSNFRYHGNRGWSETNFAYTVKFADAENPLFGATIRNMSPIKAPYSQFSVKILNFFFTMATGVGLRQISRMQLNSPTAKPPTLCKNQEHISHKSPVIANFLLKFSNFRCHGNQGRSGVSANDTTGFAAIENPHLVQESGTYLP